MTRDNNIYGKLVNNKFSDLLTADMDTTWLQMKAVLDREMPQDKEKRRALWISWRSTGTILAIALLSASIFYYSYNKRAEKISSSSKDRSQGHKPGKGNRSVQDNTKPLDSQSGLFGNDNNEEFLAVINSSNSRLTTAPKSIPFYQSIANANQTTNTKTSTGSSSIQTDLAIYHDTDNEIESTNKTAYANQFSTNYTGEGNTSDGIGDHKWYFISAMPVIEGLSTDKLLSKGDLIIPGHLSSVFTENKKPEIFQQRSGWVLGAAIHYNAPMSNQEMSTLNINGKKNTLIDFIPSVFAQYHFNNKWYVETGFQYSSPQYTPDVKLFSSCVDVAVGKRKERAVWLNKLYYMNIPLSVHFKPVRGVAVGTGIQYSHLKRSILMDEHAGWKETTSGEWTKTYSTITVNSTKKSSAETDNAVYPSTSSAAGGWGTPSVTATPATDGVEVMSKQFKSADWRYLLDLNYTWKRYTVGTKYTAGINNYINTKAEGNMLIVKDRNKALQFYIRMNVLDLRRKKR